MFFFTYVPQLAIMVFTSGPAAPLTTALLVLSESQTLFNILSKNFVIDEALIDTFDGVSPFAPKPSHLRMTDIMSTPDTRGTRPNRHCRRRSSSQHRQGRHW